jgi:hypothetical protein
MASSNFALTWLPVTLHQEDGQDYTIPTRLLRADGAEVSVDITSITVQREDLRRFRIITVLPRPDESPATVHVAGKIRLIGLDEVREALCPRAAARDGRAVILWRRRGPRDRSRTADAAS